MTIYERDRESIQRVWLRSSPTCSKTIDTIPRGTFIQTHILIDSCPCSSRGCTVLTRNRESFSEKDVRWADLVLAAGGTCVFTELV